MWTIWNVKYEYKCEKPNKMENECENYMDFSRFFFLLVLFIAFRLVALNVIAADSMALSLL